jgi:hypothetical protein
MATRSPTPAAPPRRTGWATWAAFALLGAVIVLDVLLFGQESVLGRILRVG